VTLQVEFGLMLAITRYTSKEVPPTEWKCNDCDSNGNAKCIRWCAATRHVFTWETPRICWWCCTVSWMLYDHM